MTLKIKTWQGRSRRVTMASNRLRPTRGLRICYRPIMIAARAVPPIVHRRISRRDFRLENPAEVGHNSASFKKQGGWFSVAQTIRTVACFSGFVWLLSGSIFGMQQEQPQRFFFRPASVSDLPSSANDGENAPLPAKTDASGRSELVPGAPIRINLPYSKRQFVKDLMSDQFAIWQSPLEVDRDDLRWMLPLGLTTAALLPFDRDISRSLGNGAVGPSRKFSLAGGPASIATAAALYGIGRFARKPHLRNTGLLGIRATTSAWLTVKMIKGATNRERPERGGLEQRGDFWSGGKSFPSGHSAETWALATVIAEQYRDNPWIRFGAYAFAGGVSASRVTGQKHFVSDVLIGGVIGHLIGRYVVRSWRKRRQLNALQALVQKPAEQP